MSCLDPLSGFKIWLSDRTFFACDATFILVPRLLNSPLCTRAKALTQFGIYYKTLIWLQIPPPCPLASTSFPCTYNYYSIVSCPS